MIGSPSVRCSRSLTPVDQRVGVDRLRRERLPAENASSRAVSARARCTPCSAMSFARSMRARGAVSGRLRELTVDGVEAAEDER